MFGLKKGTLYQFRVCAVNKAGVGRPSKATEPILTADPLDHTRTTGNTEILWRWQWWRGLSNVLCLPLRAMAYDSHQCSRSLNHSVTPSAVIMFLHLFICFLLIYLYLLLQNNISLVLATHSCYSFTSTALVAVLHLQSLQHYRGIRMWLCWCGSHFIVPEDISATASWIRALCFFKDYLQGVLSNTVSGGGVRQIRWIVTKSTSLWVGGWLGVGVRRRTDGLWSDAVDH